MEERRPFVLDPVFVDVSEIRCAYARQLVEREPAVVRLNAAELAALAGVDDPDPQALALEWLTIIAATGEIDTVTDGVAQASIANGHPLMARVTATGCLATAITAAFLPVSPSPLVATLSALAAMGIAGELAGGRAAGPGSFVPHFIDSLAGLTPAMLRSRTRIVDEQA